MSRPLIILVAVLVVAVAAMVGLSRLDREVPVTHVEQPVANAPQR